jgi:hypothetical protein
MPVMFEAPPEPDLDLIADHECVFRIESPGILFCEGTGKQIATEHFAVISGARFRSRKLGGILLNCFDIFAGRLCLL